MYAHSYRLYFIEPVSCANCLQVGNGCYITSDSSMYPAEGLDFCIKAGGNLPFFPSAKEYQDFLQFV